MEKKPIYYDGSGVLNSAADKKKPGEFKMTPEVRKLISGNPFYKK